jgi:hypothetical protein
MRLFFVLVSCLFLLSCESVEIVHKGTPDSYVVLDRSYITTDEQGMPLQVFDFSLDSDLESLED